VNPQDALVQLGHATAQAVDKVLRTFCGEDLTMGSVAVAPKGSDPLAMLRPPIMAADVAYVDDVAGGHMFAMTHGAARLLATAMMRKEDVEGEGAELSDLAVAAIGEAMNEVMAAAAVATGGVLGTEVAITSLRNRTLETTAQALEAVEQNVHITSVAFEIGGEPCRLIQFVPRAFTVRVTNAVQREIELAAAAAVPTPSPGSSPDPAVSTALRDVNLRIWAELGRTKMVTNQAVSLTPGAVVDLDRGVDDPVDLYVNGCRFGSGRLTLDDEQWVVEIVALEPRENLAF
jgi:flagellar motor switch protein FliN/FliY